MILAIADVGVPRHDIGELSDGDRGIQETVAGMQGVVRDALARGEIQALYSRRRSDAREWAMYVESWLRKVMQFQDDPDPYELLQTPSLMLKEIADGGVARGDCDDVAMFGATLLSLAGLRAVFIVVGRMPRMQGGRFEHVYYGYLIDPAGPIVEENVVPFDPQERMEPGVWPARFHRIGIYAALQ